MSAPRPPGRLWPWALATAIVVLAVPFAVHGAVLLDHAASYSGVCGPHAPDIAAHPCTRAEHMAELTAGFSGVGLLLVEGASLVGAGAVAAVGWMVALAVRARRKR